MMPANVHHMRVAGKQTVVPENMEEPVNAFGLLNRHVKLEHSEHAVQHGGKTLQACEVPRRFWLLNMIISWRRLGAQTRMKLGG